MNPEKKKFIAIVLLIDAIIVAIVLYYVYNMRKNPQTSRSATTSSVEGVLSSISMSSQDSSISTWDILTWTQNLTWSSLSSSSQLSWETMLTGAEDKDTQEILDTLNWLLEDK